MWSKIQAFMSRHRRKFVITGVVVGGAYMLSCYVRKALRDWQEKETRELLDRTRKQQHYDSIERTYNKSAMTLIPTMKDSIYNMCDTEAIVAKLKEGNGNKLALWEELKNLAFAKVILVVYVSSILMVTLRLQLSLIGGYLFKATVDETKVWNSELHEKYLSTLTKYLIDNGAREIYSLILEKVQMVLATRSLKDKMSIQEIEQIFWSIHSAISKDVRQPWLQLPYYTMPVTVENLPHEQREAYRNLISETIDLLESEEITNLTSSSISRGLSNFVDKLAEYFVERTGSVKADSTDSGKSLKSDAFFSSNIPEEQGNALLHHRSIPMAKVIPILNGLVSSRDSIADLPHSWAQQLILMDELKMMGANVYEAFSV